MDIPQHKALERGQQLTKVHISHPQSPSIVHVKFCYYLLFFILINSEFLFSLCYMKILIQHVDFFMIWLHILNFKLIMHQHILLSIRLSLLIYLVLNVIYVY